LLPGNAVTGESFDEYRKRTGDSFADSYITILKENEEYLKNQLPWYIKLTLYAVAVIMVLVTVKSLFD